MKKTLHIGVIVLMLAISPTILSSTGEKTIDTNQFSFGDASNYVNMTTNEIEIGSEHFSNLAKIFVYNNATYNNVVFDITGKPSLNTGEYLSDVSLDLGKNNNVDYRFGGTGVGEWGRQTYFMNEDKVAMKSTELFPSEEGNLYYLKLPSDAVVTSTKVKLDHTGGPLYKTITLTSSNSDWARFYAYYSSYGYWYGESSAGSCWNDNNYPYYYPWQSGYLKWNIDDPAFSIPPGATILTYNLVQGRMYISTYRNYISGTSGSYHHESRYYSVYGVTEKWPSTTGSQYFSWSSGYSDAQKESYIKNNVVPGFRSTPEDRYFVDEYFGSSSTNYQYGINWDLSDILLEWMDKTLDNNGIMLVMDETPHYTGLYHRSGYSTSSSYRNYYSYNYRGYWYSPSYSSSYAPYLSIGYQLDSENPWLDIGDDGNNDWSYDGKYEGTTTIGGLQGAINQYLRRHFPDEVDDYGNYWSYVPVRLGADSAGKISVSDLEVQYNYTAKVYYTPKKGNIVNELNSIVPKTEEGWSLIDIAVTSATTGVLKFDNLHLTGTKPNYRPIASEIPSFEVEEGAIIPDLVKVNDHFQDVDQDARTLNYIIQKNSRPDHVDLYLDTDEEGNTWLGLDTSKDENWFGVVTCQISATDDFGKDAWSNEFTIDVRSVNDLPYPTIEFEDITTMEGVDTILLEYDAPEGRSIALGKEILRVPRAGTPYFADIEGQAIYLDFELLGPDMTPTELYWTNEDGQKIYRGEDNKVYLTVLPPEYTDDTDNYLLLFGSDPDFNTADGPYYLRIYASDDRYDVWNQTTVLLEVYIDPVNDKPTIMPIPDIAMDEDTSYTSTFDFVQEYLSDIDNDMNELKVTFVPSSDSVMISLNEEGRLHVELELDFNGVVPVTVEVTDGDTTATGTFNVRVRTVNDPPIVVVRNLFNGLTVNDLFRIKGFGVDIEKDLRSVEVAVKKVGDVLYPDDWVKAEGAYVWQYLLDPRDLNEGEYVVMVRAFDGRDFSEVLTYNVKVRSMVQTELSDPPTVTIVSPLVGDLVGTIIVEGKVSDDTNTVSFVEYRIDGGVWRKATLLSSTEWEAVMDTRIMTNEEHNLSVRAYDEKSYSSTAYRRFEVYNEDSDGDGIPNDIEISLLMDPFNKIDGTMDFDGDGYSNQEELMVHNTDPFNGDSSPEAKDEGQTLDTWAIIFILIAVLCAGVIIALFLLNIRLERNIHLWREDLGRRRMERRPKTLLQKIVEMTPAHIAGVHSVPEGPALPGKPSAGFDSLPPVKDL